MEDLMSKKIILLILVAAFTFGFYFQESGVPTFANAITKPYVDAVKEQNEYRKRGFGKYGSRYDGGITDIISVKDYIKNLF